MIFTQMEVAPLASLSAASTSSSSSAAPSLASTSRTTSCDDDALLIPGAGSVGGSGVGAISSVTVTHGGGQSSSVSGCSSASSSTSCSPDLVDVVSCTPGPHTSSAASTSDEAINNQKRYFCQRCLNHKLEFPRKGHKPFCRYAMCHCDDCMMVEYRRRLNNQLSQRKLDPEYANGKRPPSGKKIRAPKCARCSAHGEKQALRGHKKASCPYLRCGCHLCNLVENRRMLMAKQIKLRRDQQKARRAQQQKEDAAEFGNNENSGSERCDKIAASATTAQRLSAKLENSGKRATSTAVSGYDRSSIDRVLTAAATSTVTPIRLTTTGRGSKTTVLCGSAMTVAEGSCNNEYDDRMDLGGGKLFDTGSITPQINNNNDNNHEDLDGNNNNSGEKSNPPLLHPFQPSAAPPTMTTSSPPGLLPPLPPPSLIYQQLCLQQQQQQQYFKTHTFASANNNSCSGGEPFASPLQQPPSNFLPFNLAFSSPPQQSLRLPVRHDAASEAATIDFMERLNAMASLAAAATAAAAATQQQASKIAAFGGEKISVPQLANFTPFMSAILSNPTPHSMAMPPRCLTTTTAAASANTGNTTIVTPTQESSPQLHLPFPTLFTGLFNNFSAFGDEPPPLMMTSSSSPTCTTGMTPGGGGSAPVSPSLMPMSMAAALSNLIAASAKAMSTNNNPQ